MPPGIFIPKSIRSCNRSNRVKTGCGATSTRSTSSPPRDKVMPDRVHQPWPELNYDQWADTLETVHMWTQIVGKSKLANSPFRNQWWQVGFHLTPVGLTSGPMASEQGLFSI